MKWFVFDVTELDGSTDLVTIVAETEQKARTHLWEYRPGACSAKLTEEGTYFEEKEEGESKP